MMSPPRERERFEEESESEGHRGAGGFRVILNDLRLAVDRSGDAVKVLSAEVSHVKDDLTGLRGAVVNARAENRAELDRMAVALDEMNAKLQGLVDNVQSGWTGGGPLMHRVASLEKRLDLVDKNQDMMDSRFDTVREDVNALREEFNAVDSGPSVRKRNHLVWLASIPGILACVQEIIEWFLKTRGP